MRPSPTRVRRQRDQLDARFAKLRSALADVVVPRSGWLRAIREALGMSAEQLGARLGVSKQAVRGYETGEARRSITLESLERAARALGCRVVYVVVPDDSLKSKVEAQALAAARRLMTRVGHSMGLEGQTAPSDLAEREIEELARELEIKRSPEIWDES